MNNILFRAWYKEKNKMADVLALDFTDQNYQVKLRYADKATFWRCLWCSIDDIILMQSVGIKDLKGIDVFEGDVVESIGNWKGVIEKREWAWAVCFISNIHGYVNGDYDFVRHLVNSKGYLDGEIIGNIHQHPELLESNANKNNLQD